MKEIEFRGRTKPKKWRYGLIDMTSFADVFNLNPGIFDGIDSEIVERKTISQYIGVKDCNEKKIFEGDILCFYIKDNFGTAKKDKLYYAKVEYDNYYCCWLLEGINCGVYKFGDKVNPAHCKVVGNIWDNPELLKGSEV